MIIKKYSSNLVSVTNGKPMCILSANKKDAIKLVKPIKGITIGHSFDIVTEFMYESTYNDMMNNQQSLLKEAFEKGMVKINEIK